MNGLHIHPIYCMSPQFHYNTTISILTHKQNPQLLSMPLFSPVIAGIKELSLAKGSAEVSHENKD